MLPCKPIIKRISLFLVTLVALFTTETAAQDGKALYQANCQACHALDKNLTGPALRGFTERGPWSDREELYKWIHNPAAYIATSEYANNLKNQYGSIMQAFPQLTNQQIDAIVDYIATAPPPTPTARAAPAPTTWSRRRTGNTCGCGRGTPTSSRCSGVRPSKKDINVFHVPSIFASSSDFDNSSIGVALSAIFAYCKGYSA